MNTQNITLIGMTSCGKTTLGKKLAYEYGMNFVDFDEVITSKYDRVINQQGESKFKEIEEHTMLQANGTNTIFACGGSAVYSENAMNHLKSISKIIYLKVPLEIIKTRLGVNSAKQIIGSKSKTLQEIYNEREPLYQKYSNATVEVNTNSISRQYVAVRAQVVKILT